MEILLLLLLAIGIVFYFSTREKDAMGGRPSSGSGAAPSHWGRTVEPFDETTSKRVRTEQVLQGRVYVTDGDTITLAKTQIRLFGIDAPEMAHPYGKIAKNALYDLCKGQTIRAVVTAKDAHGRTVARCFLPDGRDLSAEMVKLGLAID
jgi:endonuclease YncB( thermonuclease family)